jgi:hypothetical protein
MGVEPEIVFESQRRALLYHKAIEARSRVGEWFGYKIGYPSEYENTSRWNDYLSAAIALSNIKMSYNSKARAILHLVPRQILFLYLLLFKLLTNF